MRTDNELLDRVRGRLSASVLGFLILAGGLSILNAMLVVGIDDCLSHTNSLKCELVRFMGG